MNCIVRRAQESEIEVISSNVVAMALDGSGIKLSPEIVLQGVRNLFSRPELGFYIVAEYQSRIVGSLVIVYEWSDWRNGVYWWIHSVYVDPAFRRRGIYSRMYEFVRSEAKIDPLVRGIYLSVNKSNQSAQATYEKLGMKQSHSIIYQASDV